MDDKRIEERQHVEQGQLVMPSYLICDVSYSMEGDMAALNKGLQRLRQAIVIEPVVDDVAQLCIMMFSDTAKMLLPMSSMSEVTVPTLAVQGRTNYGAAFELLAHTIEQDKADLRKRGYMVFRPCAFFLTDGEPLEDD